VIILDDIPNHSPNGSNGIAGSTDTDLITYNDAFPITISFWDPTNPSLPATTDFVSITGDLWGSIHTVSFDAFDIFGNLIDSDSGRDIGGRVYREIGSSRGISGTSDNYDCVKLEPMRESDPRWGHARSARA
jgi:hypothetical protein